MNRYTQSGCFGSPDTNGPIDDLEDVAETVGDIAGGTPGTPGTVNTSDVEAFEASIAVLAEYLKRVRVLTWAVVALALVVILREVN